jgi:hypothetical protein
MKMRTALVIAATTVSFMTISSGASAASLRAKFSFEGIADCTSPPVHGFPIHGDGTGQLSSDRRASLDFNSNVEGQVRIDTRLGARPSEAPGGTASLRVAGRHTLRAIRNYPNNSIIIDMNVVGNSCTMKVTNVLKPGKSQYTFYTATGGYAYCSRPQITRAECSPF